MKQFFADVLTASGTSLYEKIAAVLLVLLPVLYTISPSVADGGAVLLGVLFLVHSYKTKAWGWLREAWVVCALVLWVYMTVRGFFAEDVMEAMRRGVPWLRFPLFAVAVGYWLFLKPEIRAALYKVLSITLLFLLADTLFQYVVGLDILGRETFPAEGGGVRLTGPFTAPKVGIILVWFGFPVLIGWLVPPKDAPKELALRHILRGALLLVSFIAVVFLTGERMAFLFMGFGLVVAMVLQPAILRRLWLPALAAAVAVVLFCWSNPMLVSRQVDSTLHSLQHVKETPYGMIWSSAAAIIEKNPVFGVGARHFRIVCPRPEYGAMDEATVKLRCNLHPHNMYLEWLTEGGLVAFVLVLVMIAVLCNVAVKAYRISHDAVLVGVLAGIAIRFWPLSTAVSGFVGWSAVPMWLLIGWMISYSSTMLYRYNESE